MNKILKTIVVIVGLIVLGYGVYTLITPETMASIGSLKIKSQDNTNSYIVIGVGIVILAFGLLFSKK